MRIARWVLIAAGVTVALFGWRPFESHINAAETIEAGYTSFESGARRLPDGTYQVSALTRMPNVKAHMVRWWFTDFLQTTEHYTWWHPEAHVWMGWENKVPGEIVGASHLVHEYIGDEMQKLRIQFVDPTEFFIEDPNDEDTFALCARPGLLDEPLIVGRMCHVVRNTPWGAEMRSRFWLGHVAARDGNEIHQTFLTAIANTAIVRYFALDEAAAVDLLTHAIEEMGYLGDLLPELYERETGDTSG